jgi:hypothetical protein
VGNIQIEEETELSMGIGQKPLKVLKKHGITLRGQEKRMLAHVPYASGEDLFIIEAVQQLPNNQQIIFPAQI